jgi:von Willebrand factor type A domain-containing protein
MIPAAHVIFILDDSGSMVYSKDVTKKSFDGMVEALQLCKGADIVMSLIKYGTRPKLEYARTHIQEVEPVKYYPSSSDDTIYDSLLYAIELASRAPREEKTIIILQADGGDTCSRAKPPQVHKAVMEAKARGMEFLFLGANYVPGDSKYLDSICGSMTFIKNCAKKLGFTDEEVMFYDSGEGKESAAAFEETAANIGSVASGIRDHAAYTPEQQAKVRKG